MIKSKLVMLLFICIIANASNLAYAQEVSNEDVPKKSKAQIKKEQKAEKKRLKEEAKRAEEEARKKAEEEKWLAEYKAKYKDFYDIKDNTDTLTYETFNLEASVLDMLDYFEAGYNIDTINKLYLTETTFNLPEYENRYYYNYGHDYIYVPFIIKTRQELSIASNNLNNSFEVSKYKAIKAMQDLWNELYAKTLDSTGFQARIMEIDAKTLTAKVYTKGINEIQAENKKSGVIF